MVRGLVWQAGAGASVAVCVGRSGGLSVTVGVGPEADVVQEEGIVSGEAAGSSGDVDLCLDRARFGVREPSSAAGTFELLSTGDLCTPVHSVQYPIRYNDVAHP